MKQTAYGEIVALAEQPAAVDRSVAYVAQSMARFLRKEEKVLICFPKRDNACCHILERAISRCDCQPIWLGEDQRWITIIRTAFTTRCNCIVAPPLMLLGLSKAAKHRGIPLYARNAVVSGYPAPDWMLKAIEAGLDCKVWGCFDPGLGPVISGFSCGHSGGVHIRTEEYGVEIMDEAGNLLPEGEEGFVRMYPKENPQLRVMTGDLGSLDNSPCPCGCESPRLLNLDIHKGSYQSLSDVGEKLHYWSSILDCRLFRSEYGVELEAIFFQGEKLPKFPSCAKMVLRPWNPETDVPFDHHGMLKNQILPGFDH